MQQAAAQQTEHNRASGPGAFGSAERQRVEKVVESLTAVQGRGETVAEVAHDARNMVTALALYCDLLDEPGVLMPQFRHYGNELQLVAAASRRLVEKLIALDARRAAQPAGAPVGNGEVEPEAHSNAGWDLLPAVPIRNLAREVLASRNLLAALAGPAIAVTVDAEGGALPVRLGGEELTRVLVNLVRNAAEAMPKGGRIRIAVGEERSTPGAGNLMLTIKDNGPGIAGGAYEAIFAAGYTTHAAAEGEASSHRGLGLAVSRSIIEAAGGRIRAVGREGAGACFEIVLPIAAW